MTRVSSNEAIKARVWIGVLGAMWFALLAFSYTLSIFQEALATYPAWIEPSENGGHDGAAFTGQMLVPAGYGFTAWWVQRPTSVAGAILSCAVAFLWLSFAASARRSQRGPRRRPVIAWYRTGWMRWLGWGSVAAYLLPGALSWLLSIVVQRWIVDPDEAWRERPFLQAHIAMQRLAWKLDAIEEVPLRPLPISAAATTAVARNSPPMPLWDEASFGLSNEAPSLNSTPASADRDVVTTCVSVDRYEAPPMRPSQPSQREIRAVRVREDGDEVRASRPRDRVELFSLSRPRVVPQSKLEGAASAALQVPDTLPSSSPETALACGLLARRARLRPAGATGGVPVQNWVRRVAWAWRLRFPGLLWARMTGQNEAHLWVQRDVMERATTIAPFLTSGDVSAVIIDNRLVWIVDLLTTSKSFPGALGLQLRTQSTLEGVAGDAAKMVIDAHSGATQLFMSGAHAEADPLLRAWGRAFPGLVRPFAEMPQAIRAHRRYPRALMARQLMWLERYHESNAERAAETWIEREKWWQAVRDQASLSSGSEDSSLSRAISIAGSNGIESRVPSDNSSWGWQAELHARASSSLVAVLHAGNDGEHYGRLQLLRFTTPLRAHSLMPRSLEVADSEVPAAVEAAGANELDATQRMKWRLQRGKVLVALMPATSSARAASQPALDPVLPVHVLMLQPIYHVALDKNGEAAQPDVWPLRLVLAGDAMQPQRGAGQGSTIEQAWRDWAAASTSPNLGLPVEFLRRALQWHEQAEAAAKAGDWAGAGALRQRERELLQRLLNSRAEKPSSTR